MLKIPDQRTARLLALANYIEESDDFNMNDWDNCICGKACKLFDRTKATWDRFDAERILDLERTEGQQLFIPCLVQGEYDKITNKVAARALRHFAMTGEVRFDIG